MIAYIRGVVKYNEEDSVIVESGGLGYQITVGGGLAARLRPGDNVELFTHMQLKEDGAQLFGFGGQAELRLFKMILSVSGIGPKGAMAALSALGADGFISAVVAEDITMITKTPGVGKKTAQRLVIELRDKLVKDTGMTAVGAGGSPAVNDASGEVLAAMQALGYSGAEIMPIMKRVLQDAKEDVPVEQLIKLVLKQIAAG